MWIIIVCVAVAAAIVLVVKLIEGPTKTELKPSEIVAIRKEKQEAELARKRELDTARWASAMQQKPGEKAIAPRTKKKVFHVTGTAHYQDAFSGMLAENEDYGLPAAELKEMLEPGEKVWQYEVDFSTVALVPEPENEYDPNAVRVELDGIKVGYIKKGSCSQVKNLLKSDKYVRTTAETFGGKYKSLYVWEDDDGDSHERIEKGDTGVYGVTVTIETKE